MRKTFLTFLAATFALLAVSSCGKLEDSISQLDQELKDLAARVDKLEKELNEKIEALKGTVAELDAAYKAADAALKTELEAKITATDGKFVEQLSSLKSELEEKIGKNASQEDLEALVKELSAKYEEHEVVEDTSHLVQSLTGIFHRLDGVLKCRLFLICHDGIDLSLSFFDTFLECRKIVFVRDLVELRSAERSGRLRQKRILHSATADKCKRCACNK